MFIIEIPNLNLQQIYKSGQCFRWIKISDDKYMIPYMDKITLVGQQRDKLCFVCSEEDFYNVWYDYFDCDFDYSLANRKISQIDDFNHKCAVRSSGVRILKQELWEMIVTFMLATATSIDRIGFMVNKLCEVCKEKHHNSLDGIHVTWYEFPTYESILSHQDDLDDCRMGFRKTCIIELCQDIKDGWFDINDLYFMNYDDAKEQLMTVDGIGEKVADCICLFGLGMKEAFPIDTHINQILRREWLDVDDFDSVKSFRGLAQQYIFYNELKEREVNGHY